MGISSSRGEQIKKLEKQKTTTKKGIFLYQEDFEPMDEMQCDGARLEQDFRDLVGVGVAKSNEFKYQ